MSKNKLAIFPRNLLKAFEQLSTTGVDIIPRYSFYYKDDNGALSFLGYFYIKMDEK